MKSGDVLLIAELSRLSRSFLGMVNEISKLIERGIVKTVKSSDWRESCDPRNTCRENS